MRETRALSGELERKKKIFEEERRKKKKPERERERERERIGKLYFNERRERS